MDLKNKIGVEIGGSSPVFVDYKIYDNVSILDGINMNDNYWQTGNLKEEFSFKDRVLGKQYLGDASDENFLSTIEKKYDYILHSHVIEHIANPIKTLLLWKKYLLKDKHLMISIIPYKDKTFDNLRHLTTLDHLIEDYKNDIDENDQTHIHEAINYFDVRWGGDYDSYKINGLDNYKFRVIHHHCFNMKLVQDLYEYCGYKIIQSRLDGFNIFIVAEI